MIRTVTRVATAYRHRGHLTTLGMQAGRSLRRRSSEDSPVGTSRRLWPQLWAQGQRSSPTLARPSTSPHAQRQSNHATPVGEPQRAVPAPGSFGALQPAGVTPAMLRVASHDDLDDDLGRRPRTTRTTTSHEGTHDRMLTSLGQLEPSQHASTSATRQARGDQARRLSSAEAPASNPPPPPPAPPAPHCHPPTHCRPARPREQARLARALAAAEAASSDDESDEEGEPFFGYPALPPAFGAEASAAASGVAAGLLTSGLAPGLTPGVNGLVEAGRAGARAGGWLEEQAQQQRRTERRHEGLVARRRLLEAARRDESARREEAREEAARHQP